MIMTVLINGATCSQNEIWKTQIRKSDHVSHDLLIQPSRASHQPWDRVQSPHVLDVEDKASLLLWNHVPSTDFTHYFADFVKKYLTPPTPLGLGSVVLSFSNTLFSLPIPTTLWLC